MVYAMPVLVAIPIRAQFIAPTTPNNAMYSTFTAGTQIAPFMQNMGTAPDPYVMPYVNTGAFQYVYALGTREAWVSDFDYSTGTRKSVVTYRNPTTTATFTELDGGGNIKAIDPDVVYCRETDELLVTYIRYTNSNYQVPSAAPGNFIELRLELFTATNAPVTVSNNQVVMPSNDMFKNPNIDISQRQNACVVWQQRDIGTPHRVRAKAWTPGGGLSLNTFELDPSNWQEVEYTQFYNPDVACSEATMEANDPIYITFMGVRQDGGVDLLLYRATYAEVSGGLGPFAANLTVLQSGMPTIAGFLVGDPQNDILYEPRIACVPTYSGVDNYCVTIPWLYQGGNTAIMTYAYSGFSYSTFNLTDNTTASFSTECSFNYEPAISVGTDGYQVVWTNSDVGIIPFHPLGGGTGTPINPFNCGMPFEQVVLQRRVDLSGFPYLSSDYSHVSDNLSYGSYGPSTAFFPGNYGNAMADVMYGFHDQFAINGPVTQYTYTKESDFNNVSLKWDEQAIEIEESQSELGELVTLDAGLYLYESKLDNWSLYDMMGRQMNITAIERQDEDYLRIDLTQFSSGTYLLQNSVTGQTKKLMR